MNHDNDTRAGRSRPGNGFTLLELMIVVAIIAILAAIAVPTYGKYVVHTKRNAAESCLSEYANYMERYYTTNMTYKLGAHAALPLLACAGDTQTKDYYSYSLASATTSKYTLKATPIHSQATRDGKCGTLSLTQSGTRGIGGSGTVEECWK